MTTAISKVSGTGYPKMTPKMLAVLKSIVRRNPDGTLMDVYQLVELHGQGASYQAMQFTLGHLARQGFIERSGFRVNPKNRSGGHPLRTLAATEAGINRVRPRHLPTEGL